MATNFDTPEILYKYRTWDESGFARSMISFGQVHFAKPSTLNDPFDFAIEPTPPTNATHKDRIDYLVASSIGRNDGTLGKRKAKEMARKKLRELGGRFDFETNFDAFLESAKRFRDKRFGVLSLSENCLSHLMWPHYSDNHRGVCIGVRAAELHYLIRKELGRVRWVAGLHRMNYTCQYPETDIFKVGGFDPIIKMQIDTKYEAWEYEQEWRGVMAGTGEPGSKGLLDSDRTMDLGPDAVDRVILGMRMCDRHATEIADLIRGLDQPPKLFRVIRKYNSFDLDLERIAI